MFSGIVEGNNEIIEIKIQKDNLEIWLNSENINQYWIDQSISHNGICLTIDKIVEEKYRVVAIDQTMKITNIGNWKNGDKINVERSLKINDRIDGHIVQGHVDSLAECIEIENKEGSTNFKFILNNEFLDLIIEKGSICIDGISLTCHSLANNSFWVSVIPYTFNNTNVQKWEIGYKANIEFDIIGKYLKRSILIQKSKEN